MTIFSIVYNGYGRFIPQWNEYLNKQTSPIKKLIVLGKDHGADLKYLKKNDIDYIEINSDNMGALRNAGLGLVKTDWWLYFSIDDELLPNAVEYILKQDADAVSLTFDVIEPNGSVKEKQLSPCINEKADLIDWQRSWGGYVAVKGNTDIRHNEDIEVPNLTLHFELFRRGLKTVRSKEVLAIHHRWDKSHHFRATATGETKKFVKEINKVRDEILKELGETMKKVKVRALDTYERLNIRDKEENEVLKKGYEFKVIEERLDVLLGKNIYNEAFVEVVEETLEDLTVKELKEIAEERNIDVKGLKKAEIIELLND